MLDKLSLRMISKINNPEVKQFIQDHLTSDPAELVLSEAKYPSLPIKEIAIQIASRQKAKSKLPKWYSNDNIIFPPKENLEQASSELTAKFKSRWVSGNSMADLTGGTGIDLFFMSNNFKSCVYVEPDSDLAEIAKFNFGLFEKNINVFESSAEDYINSCTQKFDLIYLDPSRRDIKKNRVFSLIDYQPNVFKIYDHLLRLGKEMIVKTSPMIDIKSTLELLPHTFKVQVLAVDNEVKEVLFYINKSKKEEPIIEAWNISKTKNESSFRFSYEEEKAAHTQISPPLTYLYEPNSAIRKAGAFNLIGNRFRLKKLHANTHLYTSNEIVDDFPGRVFEVRELIRPNKRGIKKAFPTGKVNVISKNYPIGANEIKKKYKLTDGGDEFLIFCEEQHQKISLKCILIQRERLIPEQKKPIV